MVHIFLEKPNPLVHVPLEMNIISVSATNESEGLNKAMEKLEIMAKENSVSGVYINGTEFGNNNFHLVYQLYK